MVKKWFDSSRDIVAQKSHNICPIKLWDTKELSDRERELFQYEFKFFLSLSLSERHESDYGKPWTILMIVI